MQSSTITAARTPMLGSCFSGSEIYVAERYLRDSHHLGCVVFCSTDGADGIFVFLLVSGVWVQSCDSYTSPYFNVPFLFVI